MDARADTGQDVLTRLRWYIEGHELALNSRLPPERQLCGELATSRSQLRKALAVLETEGQVWRHVGRGTFIGARPVENISDVEYLSGRTSPAEVMEARLSIEPELARLASLHATTADVAEMRRCAHKGRTARQWRIYEAWDNRLHRAIANSTRNTLLIAMFDTLNIVRRATVWGRLRTQNLPPPDHHSFDEHDTLIEAIARRDPDESAGCMRNHLRAVRDEVLASYEGTS